jgi:hypothetical protein
MRPCPRLRRWRREPNAALERNQKCLNIACIKRNYVLYTGCRARRPQIAGCLAARGRSLRQIVQSLRRWQNFFTGIGRNPLKSPDSEK